MVSWWTRRGFLRSLSGKIPCSSLELMVSRSIIYEKSARLHLQASPTPPIGMKSPPDDTLAGSSPVGGHVVVNVASDKEPLTVTAVRSPWNLTWPPVLPDHSVPPEDGFDVMPLLNIKVPRFWTPPV